MLRDALRAPQHEAGRAHVAKDGTSLMSCNLIVIGRRTSNSSQIKVRGVRLVLSFPFLLALTVCVSAQTATDIVKRKQDAWMRCLKESYGVNRKRTPDRNAAMEMAFQACATEEDDLWAYSAQSGVPRSSFMALKSATKQVILEGK